MKRFLNRSIAVFLSLIILLGSMPIGVSAVETNTAEVWVNGEMKFSSAGEKAFEEMWRAALQAAPLKTDSGEKAEVVLKIFKDWNAASGSFGEGEGFRNGAVCVPSNKIVEIDLNGFSINRGLTQNVAPTSDGMVIYVEKGAQLTVKDSNSEKINKGRVENGVWYKDEAGADGISGGVITGGYNLGDGGALYMEEQTSVVFEGGNIAGNLADDGGAIQIEGETARLQMSETVSVSYNKALSQIYGGGGICVDGSGVTVAGGNIKNNSAKYGGGIYCYAESVSIVGVTVEGNSASKDGGGIYAQETGASVSGCILKNNSAGENGGAMFIYNSGASLSDSVVEENSAIKKGDGVFVTKDCDLSVSGKLTVKNNGEENIYLEGNDDLVAGSMSRGSEVYISLAGSITQLNGSEKPFVSSTADTKPDYFFSDIKGYYVLRQNDPSKNNYRYLYFEKGERPEINSQTLTSSSVNTAYGICEGNNGVYNLYRGNFEYASVLDSVNNYAPVFYYSDGYFDSDPRKYNSHLATMSLNIAMSAFGKNTEESDRYYNQFGNVKQLLSDIGFSDESVYINDDYTKKPAFFGEEAERLSTIGVIIANKKIKIADTEYTLIPLAVRGAGYEIEWGSNATLGTSGESKGFADAATQTFALVEQYIKDYGLEDAVKNGTAKFWLMGYSRASVTANITAKRLIDKYGQNNDIYGYCFEVPQGGSDESVLKEEWTDYGEYRSIHNLINKADFVTLLMPTEMGLKRYGVDHYVPGDPEVFETPEVTTTLYNGGNVTVAHDNKYEGYEVSYNENSAYYKQRQLMVKQLEAVNPDLQFEDYFHEATINYVGYVVGMKDLIGEISPQGVTPDKFVPDFFEKLQQWALCNNEVGNYREYFTTYKPWSASSWGSDKPADLGYFESEMTVEEAIVVVIKLIFGKSDEDADALIDILLSSALGISAVDFTDISLLEVYAKYIRDWHNRSRTERVEMGNKLISAILKERYPGADTVFDYLTDEEAEELLEALPVVLDLLLTFVGKDYTTKVMSETQYYLGTFAYNMNTLIMAHYPEINLAWLRSYDSFYENDTTAYIIEATSAAAPSGTLYQENSTLTLNAAPGSAIYYSTDSGASWNLYRRAIAVDPSVQQVKAYAVSFGVRSAETVITPQSKPIEPSSSHEEQPNEPENNGKTVVIVASVVAAASAAVAAAVVILKRKKKNNG